MTLGLWMLDEQGKPFTTEDPIAWGKWYETADRTLAREHIGGVLISVLISTVFLALDHQYGEGPPVLWETMIFGGKHDGYQKRYSSKEEALEGHKRAVLLVKEST